MGFDTVPHARQNRAKTSGGQRTDVSSAERSIPGVRDRTPGVRDKPVLKTAPVTPVAPSLDARGVLGQIMLSENLQRYGIACFVLLFGIFGALSAVADSAAGSSTPRIVAVLLLSTTTVPVAIVMSRMHLGTMWWTKEAPRKGLNTAFVVYADIGITLVLLTFKSTQVALFGTTLFATVAAFVAHFVQWRLVVAHIVFTSLVIVSFMIRVMVVAEPPATGVADAILGGIIALVVANGVVILHRTYTIEFQKSLKKHLDSANSDPLTGILNRRGFHYWATRLVRDRSVPFMIAIVDVDHYKKINDDHGHAVGDAVLARIAEMLRITSGGDAVVGRIGGDEFAIAAPADLHEAAQLSERIRNHTLDLLNDRRVTMSIGAVVYPDHSGHATQTAAHVLVQDALSQADAALFRAKESGRNTYSISAVS